MQKDFQVIHIATSHTGGAGIAARRLNLQLNLLGVHSSFYALNRKSYSCELYEYKLKKRLHYSPLRVFATCLGVLTKRISFFSIYSSPGISLRSLKRLSSNKNTIYHIHNWFNIFSINQLGKLVKSGLPIVLTMHDQRLMTGGCHNSVNCRHFLVGCQSCPEFSSLLSCQIERNARKFIALFSSRNDTLSFIAPSKYMQKEAKKSLILRNQNVVFIPNIVPHDFLGKEFTRDRKAGKSEIVVGIANLDISDPLKGGDLINQLVKQIHENKLPIRVLFLVNFKNGNEKKFWSAIDCLLLPSRADNSPNVLHEAKILGIPVIATSVGGIPEMLVENFDISLDPSTVSTQTLLDAIGAIGAYENNPQIRKVASDEFSSYKDGWDSRLLGEYFKVLQSSIENRLKGRK